MWHRLMAAEDEPSTWGKGTVLDPGAICLAGG
jgi:hypothetical protein